MIRLLSMRVVAVVACTVVPPTLARWGVLSSKVLQFEREWGGEYKSSWTYPPLSLATADTHDMVSIAGFWSGHDIDIRRSVGLIESDEDAQRAHEERSRDREALLRRLAEERVLPGPVAPRFASDLRGAVHAFLCRTPAQLVGIALDDLSGEIEPVNVPGVGHMSIDKNQIMQRKVISEIDAVVFGRSIPASGVQKPRQQGAAGAVRAGTANTAAVR